MKFCYVILHYKTDVDTIECVRSIFASDDLSDIVIVDNASRNGSIEKVKAAFAGEKRVHILENEENLGFASGNNVGYVYARETLQADTIAISNNDILIVTKDFPGKVREVYEETGFHVMGPDIESIVDGGHQNPMEQSFHSAREVRKEILRYRILLALSKTGIYDLLKPNKQVRTGSSRKTVPAENVENVTVHGSFVIFSPKFTETEAIAFRTGTFLYTEEAILKKYCDRCGYKVLFSPALHVQHKEDSATNSLKLTTRERREFVFRNMIRSLTVYLDYF